MSKAEPKQAVNGILLVNKPQGLSSNALLQQVKRLFNAKKAGHTGSLDPLATGMLPICFGEATKFCQYLLDADKSYEATGLLGIKTTTGDALGETIASLSSFDITKDELEKALNQFKGSIKQVPSMYSALKHKGTPLYKYAREGIAIEREARDIKIYKLDLQSFDGTQFDIDVTCSKGTYIRNLVEDIGEQLGVGAHVTRLHRTHTAGFADEEMYTLAELQNKSPSELMNCLLPMERAVNYLPKLELKADELLALRQGKVLDRIVTTELEGCVRLYIEGAVFVGLGEVDSASNLSVKRLLAFS
ncbi:tRNA pseudouridine(55) synthase TruB [Legionella massiliensis]|nr:tRNA pseudouridine(55) synthase TruB [Legionella massiliensis]